MTHLPLDGSVIKMKGLPFKATVTDILRFFKTFNLQPESIYLKRHPDGRPNGESFVVLESPEEARRATQKDRETFGEKFGDRYVRVYPTLESDILDMQATMMQHQSMSQNQVNGHSHAVVDSVVKIKSLPFDATQLDVIQFFNGYRLKPNGVQLVLRSDNKPTGEAFVDFDCMDEAVRATREKDHKVFSEKFGDRYVRLIQITRKEMQATLALRFGGEGILKIKGIPFKATAADVRDFFTGYRIKPEGISFIMHADGRPTGMAFIEFETPQEAVRAIEKDRAKFGPEYGDRFCMLQLVGRNEMEKVQLQRESECNASKLQLPVQNNFTMLQAAALATQAAFQNPALLMHTAANPWLTSALQLGLLPGLSNQASSLASHYSQFASSSPSTILAGAAAALSSSSSLSGSASLGRSSATSMLDAATLASHLKSQFIPGAKQMPDILHGRGLLNSPNSTLDTFNLIHSQSSPSSTSPPSSVLTDNGNSNWLQNVDPVHQGMFFYHNHCNDHAKWPESRAFAPMMSPETVWADFEDVCQKMSSYPGLGRALSPTSKVQSPTPTYETFCHLTAAAKSQEAGMAW